MGCIDIVMGVSDEEGRGGRFANFIEGVFGKVLVGFFKGGVVVAGSADYVCKVVGNIEFLKDGF